MWRTCLVTAREWGNKEKYELNGVFHPPILSSMYYFRQKFLTGISKYLVIWPIRSVDYTPVQAPRYEHFESTA